jgi:hypothetical protein
MRRTDKLFAQLKKGYADKNIAEKPTCLKRV